EYQTHQGRRLSRPRRHHSLHFKYSASRSRSFRVVTWLGMTTIIRMLLTYGGLGLSAGLPAPLRKPDPDQEDGEPQKPAAIKYVESLCFSTRPALCPRCARRWD